MALDQANSVGIAPEEFLSQVRAQALAGSLGGVSPTATGGAPASPLAGTAPASDRAGDNPGLDDIPEAARNTGVSAGIGSQIWTQANKAAAANPQLAKKPGGWARILMGSLGDALGDATAAQKAPLGAGPLGAIEETMKARAERKQQQQEYADKQKQQDFENKIKEREQQRQDELMEDHKAARFVQTQKSMRTMSKDAQDEMKTQSDRWLKSKLESGAKVLREGMTDSELRAYAKENATPDDPTGMNWLKNQDWHQDGWRDVTDANGDLIPKKDAEGNLIGNDRQQTYSILTYGDPRKVDESYLADLKTIGKGENIAVGDEIPAKEAAAFDAQISHRAAEYQAGRTALAAADKSEEEIKKYEDSKDYQAATKPWLHWLNDAKNDPGMALQNLDMAEKEVDPRTGEPTPAAVQAQKDYALIQKGMGKDLIKTVTDQFEKKQLADIKANAAAAKNKPLEVEGDPNLFGEAYIKSLPAAKQPVIRAFIKGQFPPGTNLQRLLASKDGQQFLSEAALADDTLDTSRMGAYVEASKNFAQGKISNQLNSAGTSLLHLKALFDDNNLPGAFIGGDNYAKRQADLNDASLELARFLTGGTAPSNQDIESARASLDPSIFRSLNPQSAKNAAVKEQADRIREKVEEYKEQWHDAMPSPAFERSTPMPGWHKDSEDALAYLRNDGKVPAPDFSVVLPNNAGVAHFSSQAQLDQFKNEHGLK